MSQTALALIAEPLAREFDVPLALILGVIQVESAGHPYATRFEPGYRWCWDVRRRRPLTVRRADLGHAGAPSGFAAPDAATAGYYSTAATEYTQQRTSWGLMQVMGAVAREHGYTGPLPELCDPAHGIEYGVRHLARLRDRFYARHGWAGVVDAYNDGSPAIEQDPDYPDRVAAVSAAAATLINGEKSPCPQT